MTTEKTLDFGAARLDADELQLITLLKGNHKDRQHGLCVMEAAAWLAGEPHSDHPQCASPLVTRFAQRLNDNFDQDMRDALRDRLPQIVGSRSDDPEVEKKKALTFVYRMLTVRYPKALERLAASPRLVEFKDRLTAHATELRALVREDDPNSWRAVAKRARATVYDVRTKFPAYADAYADAYAYAYAYAYADPAKRAEIKAAWKAELAKDALAALDEILVIRNQ